jgi:hypothetical protein
MDYEKFKNEFSSILTTDQKNLSISLFDLISKNKWEKLIHIWETSSSLIRWNNILKELTNIPLNEKLNNIILLGLGIYVDKKTHKLQSVYLP